jgi:mono/diheme cytochrome c family protein
MGQHFPVRAAGMRASGSQFALLTGGLVFVLGGGLAPGQDGSAERGAYLALAADCAGCHTDKGDDPRPYAGGRGLPSPFGTIYTPHITPAPETGIGGWSDLGLTLG